jgi:type VI secretion system secreted protein Hcp
MANSYYLKVKGAKQGDIKGEAGKKSDRIPILGFSYGVQSPRDVSTGQASGKRQHRPVTIYKEWGVASPQLYEALVTNERLTSVTIDEIRTDPAGRDTVYMEIRLTNATITSISIDPERASAAPLWTNHEIELVFFAFEKIEIENMVSKVVAMDDWQNGS